MNLLSEEQVDRPAGVSDQRSSPRYVSDLIVDLLHAFGCRYLSLNPGASFRGLHDSLVNHGGNINPQIVLCQQEEIAVSIAHGYAKATGEVGFAAVHDLVGLMHASMGVYNAWCDQVAMLVLGGGGPLDASLRRSIDWVHSASTQGQLVREYVKWDAEPASETATLAALARAHQIAQTAPKGPTYVTLDMHLQEQVLGGASGLPPVTRTLPGSFAAPTEEIVRAVELLSLADFPLIIGGRVGRDVGSTSLLVRLAELLGAAYMDDRNCVAFPSNHPLNLTGDASVVGEADVVLAVDLPDVGASLGLEAMGLESGAKNTPTIISLSLSQLGVRSWSQFGSNVTAEDVRLFADPLYGLRQLAETAESQLGGTSDVVRSERAKRLHARHYELAALQRRAIATRWDDVPIAPSRLGSELFRAVRGRPWLLALRNTRSWSHGVWEFEGGGQFLGSSGGAGVGYGPGAIVGAALAARDRDQLAVGIVGDGDLLMSPGALWTAVHHKVPLLVVVNNNRSYFNDAEHQAEVANDRGRPVENGWIGVSLSDPIMDVAGLARSYGAWATGPIENPSELAGAFSQALKATDMGHVAVVDVHTALT